MVAIQIDDFVLMGGEGTKVRFIAGSLLYQMVDRVANRSVRAQFSIDKSGIRFSTKLNLLKFTPLQTICTFVRGAMITSREFLLAFFSW